MWWPTRVPPPATGNYPGEVSSSPSSQDPTSEAGVATAHLSIEGMHCGSCVALIEETLLEQNGVASATVDLESARAVVDYRPANLGVDALTAAIADVGYTATLAG
jgi:copper chaperone CopZ